MTGSDGSWLIPVKGALYFVAFLILGSGILKKRALPALGWAVLGGLARWIAGIILGAALAILLMRFEPPTWIFMNALGALRFALWYGLAAFIYSPPSRVTLWFAGIMTAFNFALDLMVFGWLSLSDLGSTWRHPYLH